MFDNRKRLQRNSWRLTHALETNGYDGERGRIGSRECDSTRSCHLANNRGATYVLIGFFVKPRLWRYKMSINRIKKWYKRDFTWYTAGSYRFFLGASFFRLYSESMWQPGQWKSMSTILAAGMAGVFMHLSQKDLLQAGSAQTCKLPPFIHIAHHSIWKF